LRDCPEVQLARIMEFIEGRPADKTEIESAVAFAAFDDLQRKESANFFSTDRLRPGDAANPNSFKVRRGKVGGYRDYFSPDQLARIEARIAEARLGGFGYLPDPVAAESQPTEPSAPPDLL